MWSMKTASNPCVPGGETIENGVSRFYPIVCAETFIGEDAAEAIRTFDPQADVCVVATVDDAVALLARQDRSAAVLVIAPRTSLADTALVDHLRARQLPLMVIATSITTLGNIPCRVVTAELPFTNETILDLLKRAFDPV